MLLTTLQHDADMLISLAYSEASETHLAMHSPNELLQDLPKIAKRTVKGNLAIIKLKWDQKIRWNFHTAQAFTQPATPLLPTSNKNPSTA